MINSMKYYCLRKEFYSSLNMKDISDDYEHAKKVWEDFETKT